ncbi:hypothetical protein ACP26L_12930 [Paenibacillus sp. S-38]|uniref:hypothetical protein n=1 Tax=Paenibacillus sp. S-38 TaxID=3416710 RepID=UPI003CEDEFAB
MKKKWRGMFCFLLIGMAALSFFILTKRIPVELHESPKNTDTIHSQHGIVENTTEENLGTIETEPVYSGANTALDMRWMNFLKPADSEQEVLLKKSAYVVNKLAVDEKGTLEVKQIIGDSSMIYILIDFTAVEGTVLDAKRYRFDSYLNLTSTYSASFDYILLDDENPSDNKISLMMSISMATARAIAGSPVTLQLSDLEGADVYPDEYETVVSGSWETKFILDYKDISTSHQFQQGLSLYNYAATLSSISISPLSVTIKFESSHIKEIYEEASRLSKEKGLNEHVDSYPITIHYKDGRSETTSVFNGLVRADYTSDYTTIVKPFVPIINDKEIKSIEFFNTVIVWD